MSLEVRQKSVGIPWFGPMTRIREGDERRATMKSGQDYSRLSQNEDIRSPEEQDHFGECRGFANCRSPWSSESSKCCTHRRRSNCVEVARYSLLCFQACNSLHEDNGDKWEAY
mmetsp:Transcript_17526/g.36386  ORF Transcript_17526/g.36386 Transcript_17526/m.36386 type:complete len:113 (-) Transcript_17526:2614-2952(-)